jgi:diguanylate cyclase (GGDEF)-like protein
LSLRSALFEALVRPDAPQLIELASTQYNLFVAQVSLIDNGASQETMQDAPIFHTVLAQAHALINQADSVLDSVSPKPDYPVMQRLLQQIDGLQANVHRLVIETHERRYLQSSQLIQEVEDLGNYLLVLSSVVLVMGLGWGVSAMRNLNLTLQRQQELRELYLTSSFHASHDFLTGLANRRLLYDRLQHAMASNKRNNFYGAVILIDLDNFKPINDTYGHDAGDLLLVEVANRMKGCVRDVDTVARLGGDEFAVLLEQVDGQTSHANDSASMISKKLLDSLSAPYLLTPLGKNAQPGSVHHVCTASVGVAVFFKDERSADQIIKAADAAMYRAKQHGGNRIELAT